MATFYIEGHPLYNPNLTLEQAYKKAVMLDDELVEMRDIEITKKAMEKRKEELEKAKRLKKFSGRTSNVSVSPVNPRAALEDIVSKHFAGAL
jgi:protein subunit release factor B